MVTTRSKTKSLPPARVQITRDDSEESDGDEYKLEIRAPKRLRTKVKKEENVAVLTVNLMDLPHELLREARDLISLSRTSKQWHGLLMRRSAERTWLLAESNIPELPGYPWSNISPVRYAMLLFYEKLHGVRRDDPNYCGPVFDGSFVHRMSRDRACGACWTATSRNWASKIVMTFRKKNAEKRPRGSGPLRYCLRTELEEVRATYRELTQPGCEVAFARWKTEIKDELDLRKEFAIRLRAFLRLIENTRYNELEKIKRERSNEVNKRLLALGYTEPELKIHYSVSNKWRALVEQPKVLSDRVWENLLPKLIPLLEANKAQAEEDAKANRKTKRQAELHRLLREYKLEMHPLAGMVKALGYEPKLPEPTPANAATSGANATPACISRFLNTYPFPDTYTALDWSFFKEVTSNDMSLEDVKALFDAHRKEVEEHTREWRAKIECTLTQTILLDESLPPLSDLVEVNGSTDSTVSLNPLTQLLLRADTIFTTSKNASYDDQLLHYPLFIPTKDKFWSYGWPQTISVDHYAFHSKACDVARVLLKDLGKSDASGLEMESAGKVFRCGRCAFLRPVNWDGILKHYLHEHHVSTLLSSSTPRFKTRHPIIFENNHGLEHGSLVLQDKDEGNAPVPCDPVYCLPCKNYGRMFVGVEQGQMGAHLETVHGVLSGVQNIHWGLVSDSGTFLENGGAWRKRWDDYYDEREKGNGQGARADGASGSLVP